MAAKKDQTPFPINFREGAKARKLLEARNLPKRDEDRIRAKAKELAVTHGEEILGRPDTIIRDYYIYLAMGEEMPDRVKQEWEHFQSTGKEMVGGTRGPSAPKATNGDGDSRGKAQAGAAPAKEMPETSSDDDSETL